ncbi:MAG: hypothetical protein JRJ19_03320 [Deltaproteobacteria bacterium]|nr:hypothetical protein [Deltaproteobacteria bacterium]MBW1871065.1 hypothetical protein [Deltaproteobacteria bacterium]
MTDDQKIHQLSSMPPPESPHQKEKKTSFFRKPIGIIFGAIGLIASTSTVVGLVQGWFSAEPTAEELAADAANKLAQIEQKLNAKDEDGHLVNQVSRRVTELGDQYKRIQTHMKDVTRLEKSLAKQGSAGKILTPEQLKMQKASRKKETEELLALVDKTLNMANGFVTSVEKDSTLDKVSSTDSETGQTKARALKQARQVKNKLLPVLQRLKEKYGS